MGTWNLDILYTGFDTEEFKSDMESMKDAASKLAALANEAENLDAKELLTKYVKTNEELSELVEKLAIYANLRYSANTRDTDASSMLGVIMSTLSSTAGPSAALNKAISEIDNIEEIIDTPPILGEFKYLLTNIKRDSKYLLSDKEESVLAKMDLSGASAWSDLQSSLTSGVKVAYNGEEITLSSVRNLAYSPDAEVRKTAFESELKCYDSIKDAVAFALNSIKLQVLNECDMRGYEQRCRQPSYR